MIRVMRFDFVERIETMTYDMRCRVALRFPTKVATNLGFVAIDDKSIVAIKKGLLGRPGFGLLWPRHVYGRVAQELATEGASTVAFDVVFGELRPDQGSVRMADGRLVESDEYFALQAQHASNVVVAVTSDVLPPPLFLTNAAAVADISTEKDSDGILRRVCAFRTYRFWNWALRQVEEDPDLGIDLQKAKVETDRIILRPPAAGLDQIALPLDKDGNFDLTDLGGEKLPPGIQRKQKPFTEQKIWHMGVVIAARELKLDLSNAEIDLPHGRIVLRGEKGVERVLPVDNKGYFYIDWCLPPSHPQLTTEAVQSVLAKQLARLHGETNGMDER
jgi:hypothetical protein